MDWISQVLLSTIIACAIAWAFFSRFKTNRTRDHLLLIGLSGAGKTRLFMRLCGHSARKTVASIDINEGGLKSSRSDIKHVVDIPGNRKARQQYIRYLDRSHTILIPFQNTKIDILAPQRISELAQLLYDILSADAVRNGKIRVILAATKSIVSSTVISIEKCQSEIETWLTQVRDSRDKASRLDDTSVFHYLGYDGQPMKLSDLEADIALMEEEAALDDLMN